LETSKVAFVEENSEFFVLLFTKNKILLKSLDFQNIKNSSEIQSRDDLLLIIKLTNENSIEKIRKLIKNMFSLNKENELEEKNNLNIIEESTIKYSDYKKLEDELKDLRTFKYKQKDILEEITKQKESEIKMKFKLYYEKIIENEKEYSKKLESEKESVISNNEKYITLNKDLSKKIELKEKEITKLYGEYKEKSEKYLKNNEDYEKLITDLHKTINNLEFKIKEDESRVNSLGPSTVKVDDFIIHEIPINPQNEHCDMDLKSDSFTCILCLVKMRDCLLVNCNHLLFCWDCIKDKIHKNNKKKKPLKKENTNILEGDLNCPVCKLPNFSFRKIFIS